MTEAEQRSSEFRRAWTIVAYARRFALIARRPEFLNTNDDERARHALTDEPPGPLHLFDAAQLMGSSDLDRLCGYAVALLTEGRQPASPILDLLGVLDPDRLCAIYFALPRDRRAVARRDPVWAYHVQQVDADLASAECSLLDLITDTATSDVGHAIARALAWPGGDEGE